MLYTPAMNIETELNHLRSILAQSATTLEALKAQVTAQRAALPEPGIADVIMGHLATAAGGKPGHLTVVELIGRTGTTKSKIWHHLNALDRAGKIWIQQTSRGRKDGKKHSVVHHADAIAV